MSNPLIPTHNVNVNPGRSEMALEVAEDDPAMAGEEPTDEVSGKGITINSVIPSNK